MSGAPLARACSRARTTQAGGEARRESGGTRRDAAPRCRSLPTDLERPTDLLPRMRPFRALLRRPRTDGDDEVEVLREILVEVLASIPGDVDANLGHRFHRQGV